MHYFITIEMFKHFFQYEACLNVLPQNLAKIFMKFRLLNHKLPIQKGRFLSIERNNRLCEKCNMNDIGDEFHYSFVCPSLSNARKQFLKPYYRHHPNAIKFSSLFNSKNKSVLKGLTEFIKVILQTVQ